MRPPVVRVHPGQPVEGKMEIGLWKIKNEDEVTKLGLIVASEKSEILNALWKEVEIEALTKLPNLFLKDFFFQKNVIEGHTIFSFRYYTPLTNRTREDMS